MNNPKVSRKIRKGYNKRAHKKLDLKELTAKLSANPADIKIVNTASPLYYFGERFRMAHEDFKLASATAEVGDKTEALKAMIRVCRQVTSIGVDMFEVLREQQNRLDAHYGFDAVKWAISEPGVEKYVKDIDIAHAVDVVNILKRYAHIVGLLMVRPEAKPVPDLSLAKDVPAEGTGEGTEPVADPS